MNIALVAHDGRKKEMVEWATYNINSLAKHSLFATGTTGKLISNIGIPNTQSIGDSGNGYDYENGYLEFPLKDKVTCLKSGPLGGDAEISAMIANGEIDVLIFFCDNLVIQGHNSDIQGLSRLASLYNIAFATNRTTADMILTSSLFDNEEYHRIIPKCIEDYKNRKL